MTKKMKTSFVESRDVVAPRSVLRTPKSSQSLSDMGELSDWIKPFDFGNCVSDVYNITFVGIEAVLVFFTSVTFGHSFNQMLLYVT